MRRALTAAGVVGILAILVLSLVPGDLRPHVVASDHLEHVLSYFLVMSAFGLLAGSIRLPLAAAVLLASVAGLTEALQRYVPGRHAHMADALSSGLGILLGLLLSVAVMAMLRR